MSAVEVDLSGPLFDGVADTVVTGMIDEAKHVVGQATLSEVHLQLDRNLRNPTPYYETQIISERLQEDLVVHDRGIVYGPWLEGTSSRNQSTRFKGYASFRRAFQAVEQRVPTLVSAVVLRHLRRLG